MLTCGEQPSARVTRASATEAAEHAKEDVFAVVPDTVVSEMTGKGAATPYGPPPRKTSTPGSPVEQESVVSVLEGALFATLMVRTVVCIHGE